MKLYILGICGTFMGGVAALARELGHEVAGCDANIYPPMSDQLQALGIRLDSAYRAEHLDACKPDLVIVGNALSRGNRIVERMLDARIAYVSGPQWIGENVLASRHVFAVAGTHGKTTTTAMLAWILEACGRNPGFLVGGVPENFGVSARLGAGTDFVIEADEYDTAFFDKRSKFVHYRPTVAILNNLEYDHADIFPDVAAIQRQVHHLLRTVPGNGRLIVNAEDPRLAEVLAMGAWTPVTKFGMDTGEWRAHLIEADGSHFAVLRDGKELGEVRWILLGRHNVMNALAALAAADAGGADVSRAIAALADFRSAKRRLEFVGEGAGIKVYDDFAHHPTAIATTLAGLRARVCKARILVGMEPRSNSMRLGAHADELAPSLRDADAVVFLKRPELSWDAARVIDALGGRGRSAPTVDALIAALTEQARASDHVVFMSNGGFEDAPRRFLRSLR
ncbi:MAG: UDP-N-acetylmuramate:L-alanyl-gamma-D-glutamyl-meso-diaminopimelate ligase [Xanthomonadaceae bacterium]|nr:UDP-N-acetylmuramate:L-alanyl-gamma-D-glutamyl-meso-diaminopimelate ligase [Xanthomonadaceae bacterium]MDE1960859.1 UDP-N-acetylmuramate:L-alanyl-gamma-D-glutamyl-meso-diaminopimelate ligase [Xanthomonadaceae bacterium]MDE2083743.1 UDP-N-acetylmuramate:L-alanyl-gamma-D-glutamyl-meso-diaminopimelate ligase [Xanthomonadaceae bacterium]MDE2256354.1 UDP-N-acetylmuramate:L-alanyl-gamma-D-glutamyl-meso-diaminopimelate ligase [Xanthomonadaceae bacterium]